MRPLAARRAVVALLVLVCSGCGVGRADRVATLEEGGEPSGGSPLAAVSQRETAVAFQDCLAAVGLAATLVGTSETEARVRLTEANGSDIMWTTPGIDAGHIGPEDPTDPEDTSSPASPTSTPTGMAC
jgi:hypothetical protein